MSGVATRQWGREERFAEMVERQARFMFRVAYGLLRNAQDAEDAVQEAFLKLYRDEAWRRMEDEKAFSGADGLAGGAGSAAKRGRSGPDVAEMELAATGGAAVLRKQNVVDEDERAVLRRLIDGLPEELRQPLVLIVGGGDDFSGGCGGDGDS